MHRQAARRSRMGPLLGLAFATVGGAFSPVLSAQMLVTPVSWGPCAADLVDSSWTSELGPRLECGSMPALLDDDAPALGSFEVGLVRFKAADPDLRQGSIFFNFGGPGGNPLDFLPSVAYLWSTRPADHPLDGDKRRITERYDLVAVIPRGLRGGTRFVCQGTPGPMSMHDPTIYLADWNWAAFVRDTRSLAAGCTANPLYPHIGSLQHVRDMEHARLALGDPLMNFLGISYGSWVGAYYASTYPAHTGRMVLDSVMNFAATFEDQLAEFPYELQALFARYALRPALANPAIYGIGDNAAAVMTRFRAMPPRAREPWASMMDSPARLSAALTMADWVRAEAEITHDQLIARIGGHLFSADGAADTEVRKAAMELAEEFDLDPSSDLQTPGDISSVNLAVICGDTPWRKDAKTLRGMANTISAKFPAAGGMPVMIGLACANWPASTRQGPALSELAKAPPMLLVQSEFDPTTPVAGAMRAINASPRQYLVLARNSRVHGLFGMSATPCVERAVGNFLLTGELPGERLSGCEFEPTPPSREARDTTGGPRENEVRAELARRLRRS